MNWIEINKPWYVSLEMKKPLYPAKTLRKAVFDKFGIFPEDVFNEFKNKHGKSFVAVIDSIRGKISEEVYKNYSEQSSEDQEEKIEAIMKASKDPVLVEIRKLKRLKKKIEKFVDKHPVFIAWTKKLAVVRNKLNEKEKKACFEKSELNRPGVLVEIKDNTGVTKYLIGHINKNRGVCDDCTAFDKDAIVLRAKVLVPESEFGG